MTVLTVRDAVETDLPAIVAIYNATVPSRMVTADTEPASVESRLSWFREHRPGFRPLWVAETDGRIVAWISFSSFYGRPAYNATTEISIYVAQECRRQGIGREMLQRTIDHAPTRASKRCWASSSPTMSRASGCSEAMASRSGLTARRR